MLKQTLAVTGMNLKALPQRLGTSSVIIVGIAGVVAVLVSVLAMVVGFRATMENTGRDDRALVLRGGSQAEINSSLSREDAQTILDTAGLRRDAQGEAIACPEVVVIISMKTLADASDANVTLRGTCDKLAALRPEFKLVAGRMYAPAVRELIVGQSAAQQFDNLAIGDEIEFRDSSWTVVGHFSTGGDNHESELLADNETVLSAYRRNGYQSLTAMLESPAQFTAFKDALTTNPTLKVDARTEPQYYAQQSEQLTKVLNFLAYFVGGIMAIGAMFGALNTMYTAVSSRSVEIATLRALGFSSMPVVMSVIVEAVVLALIGGLIGSALAWLFFNGNAVSTLGGNFSQVVFRLTVSGGLIVTGITWACAIGLIGGLFPAIRAARLPIAEALRAH
ncbi:ABC transporter permease [Abyssibacter sp.]|jgi:putative ABC transport system permease protein|uniref:ABC transporter permease n=1 Tax=Abyssibacter sp. TaxID=2320200 RepID=UPI0025B82685|nr:ABC transporter permease [Abyssibacter sp.]MCK5859780.1 ABC transporter permease [Abyssibacter sp.]